MSENKINRIKEYCKENIKENKKDKLQFLQFIRKIVIYKEILYMNELEKLQTGLIYNDFDEDLFQIRNIDSLKENIERFVPYNE